MCSIKLPKCYSFPQPRSHFVGEGLLVKQLPNVPSLSPPKAPLLANILLPFSSQDPTICGLGFLPPFCCSKLIVSSNPSGVLAVIALAAQDSRNVSCFGTGKSSSQTLDLMFLVENLLVTAHPHTFSPHMWKCFPERCKSALRGKIHVEFLKREKKKR